MITVRKLALAETVLMAIRTPEFPGDAAWGLSFGSTRIRQSKAHVR